MKDLVVGLDLSTSACKAIAWSGSGELVAEGRATIALSNPRMGYFEQAPDDWWRAAGSALRELAGKVEASRIAGLAISNQRETFGAFDRGGRALRPGMIWLDDRASAQVAPFGETFGAPRIHAISGRALDVNPCLYRLLWMREHEPDIFDEMDIVADVHGYLVFRLTGHWTTSIASADAMGMIDMVARAWSSDILEAAGIPGSKLLSLAAPGAWLGGVTAGAAAATGLREGTPIFAGGGDGQCAGTGAGALLPGRAFVNLGTAVVAGFYADAYRHHPAYRSEIAVAESGYILETIVRSGTFLIDWLLGEIFGCDKPPRAADLAALESQAARRPIGASGITVLPYWQGSMTPYWDNAAKGVVCGLSGSTRKADLFRGVLEGISMELANCIDLAAPAAGRRIDGYVAIGGGASSDLWLQMLADVLGATVERSSAIEASSLGAAIAAATGVGWRGAFVDAAAAMAAEPRRSFRPDARRVESYARLRDIHRDLWPRMAAWNRRLADFTASEAEPGV